MKRSARAATLLTVILASSLAAGAIVHAEPAQDRRPPSTPTRKAPAMGSVLIRFGGETVTATLEPGEAARAFRALLPLTLKLTDYNATEKIADLPRRLPVLGEPAGIDPEPGDLTYYAPWGNLAIFYKDFGSSRGLVRLGRLRRIPDAFRQPGPVTVTIEPAP
ncbi:cyclophilin-like fold protein [Methylobacterium sp. Leaf399]|uniref:cyclophilin-like fold protein n=1 Tax=Methylobacterium sp. Leaf399 TaxID=1736364 RepID=UPI000B14FFCB|nr:cyclophilin-like fold protein [Methylobacterium sp. Leaf399]